MSRSIRNRHIKNGVHLKCGGDSDKKDKRIANRKFRHKENLEARETFIQEEDKFETTDIKDVSNTYEFRSDGLAYYIDLNKSHRFLGKIPKEEIYKYKNK